MEPVELVNLRLTIRGARQNRQFRMLRAGTSDAAPASASSISRSAKHPVEYPVYRREAFRRPEPSFRPRAIEEYGSTTILFDRDRQV